MLPQEAIGVGLRQKHYNDFLEQKPTIDFLEVHAENYFYPFHQKQLLNLRHHYPISLHAVGLSLGSNELPQINHLQKFKNLIDIIDPIFISDHLSWSKSGNAHTNDLLPLPYTTECLSKICKNIDYVQNFLKKHILIENPSSYISFFVNEMTEPEFLNSVIDKTGCKLLLDINNIYVQSINHQFDAKTYIDSIKAHYVEEYHLAGGEKRNLNEKDHIIIDTHGCPVWNEVWLLFEYAKSKIGSKPTLLEWDTNLPDFNMLIEETQKIRNIA
jgi:uncharacterized protein (UPF0276 family)